MPSACGLHCAGAACLLAYSDGFTSWGMPMRSALISRIFCVWLPSALLTFAACSGEDRPQKFVGGGPNDFDAAGVGGAISSGGGVGTGGLGGRKGSAGASQGGAGGQASGSAGAGGISTVPVDGGLDDGGEPLPSCIDGSAYRAAGAAFVAPTPPDLASALSALAYEPSSHPLTIVVLDRSGQGTLAVSFSELEPDETREGFPESFVPGSTTSTFVDGQLLSQSPQDIGFLRVTDADGDVEIELQEISLDAVPVNGCDSLRANVTAVIPESQGGVSLKLKNGKRTIESLAGSQGERDAGSNGPWAIKLSFDADSIDFDFTSFPESP